MKKIKLEDKIILDPDIAKLQAVDLANLPSINKMIKEVRKNKQFIYTGKKITV